MNELDDSDPAFQRSRVKGERGVSLVAHVLSAQARLSNLVAVALMVTLGITTLAWYYGRELTRQSHIRQSRQTHAGAEATSEMVLPPLGALARYTTRALGILQPQSDEQSDAPGDEQSDAHGVPGPMPPPQFETPAAATISLTSTAVGPSLQAAPLAAVPRGMRSVPGGPSSRQRRLQGDVYAGAQAQASAPDTTAPAIGVAAGEGSDGEQSGARLVHRAADAMAAPGLLAAPEVAPVVARRLPDRTLLLSKGTFIDCTLETAIDSTLPGITTCVTASDTFSADGRVVLLERGTRLFGETQGQVAQGAARVYVLWMEARTPAGVVVPLQSPGSDELGRSGLPGTVQRHFWERFGAAILLSTIDGAVQAAVQTGNRNNGTVIYDPGASQDVMTEILKSTVAIAPTVIKRNGDRIEVLVARDVDFRSVYQLRAASSGD